jgi:hypothetical protein
MTPRVSRPWRSYVLETLAIAEVAFPNLLETFTYVYLFQSRAPAEGFLSDMILTDGSIRELERHQRRKISSSVALKYSIQ